MYSLNAFFFNFANYNNWFLRYIFVFLKPSKYVSVYHSITKQQKLNTNNVKEINNSYNNRIIIYVTVGKN